jgi:hypothetical protein
VFCLLESKNAALLGEFERLDDALAALDRLIEVDPEAAHDCTIVELDDTTGTRVGDPISRAAA